MKTLSYSETKQKHICNKRSKISTGKIWLEYSDVICHVVLLYSVDWTKACISFIFLTVKPVS